MTWSLERWKFFIICVYLCSWPVLFGTRVDKPVGVEGARLEGGCHKIGGGQTWILVTPMGG